MNRALTHVGATRDLPLAEFLLEVQPQDLFDLSYSRTCDPFVPTLQLRDRQLCSGGTATLGAKADCVLVATDHSAFDYPKILKQTAGKLTADARNAYKGLESDKIVRL